MSAMNSNDEVIKDLKFQHESLKKERRELNVKIDKMQIELTQLRYQVQILKGKEALVRAEIHAKNRPVF